MIARRKWSAAISAAVCIVSLAAGPAGAATTVDNLHLAHNDAFTELTIPVPSHLLCEHFTLPPTGDKPFRVVLDFCETRHALPQQRYVDLPTSVVTQIRTSQYAEAPQPVVRVVLDLRESATYTVRSVPDAVVIAIADPQHQNFAAWEANAKTGVASPPKPLADAQRKVKPETVSEAATVAEQAPVVAPEKTVTSTTPSKRVDVSRPSEPSEKMVNTKVSTKATVPTPDKSAPELAVAVPETEQPHPESDVRAQSPVVQAPFTLPARPLVLAPDQLELGEMAAEAVTGERQLGAQTSEGESPSTDDYAITTDDPSIWASIDAPAGAGTPIDAATPPQEQSLLERLKTKFFGDKPAPRPYTTTSLDPSATPGVVYGPPSPDGAGALDRQALLERIRLAEEETAQRRDGAPEEPERRERVEVRYDDMGRRDPFQPLLGGLRSGFVTDELPNVENLRMVGVLRDDYDAMALLEDMEGHSYILRPGDPIERGQVIAVQEERVIFQVEDYGWTRTVALQLSPRGSDPTKALGFHETTETESDSAEEDNDSKNGE